PPKGGGSIVKSCRHDANFGIFNGDNLPLKKSKLGHNRYLLKIEQRTRAFIEGTNAALTFRPRPTTIGLAQRHSTIGIYRRFQGAVEFAPRRQKVTGLERTIYIHHH